ncbi:MAG: PepSY-associated TM helix domain-containing protein, partial [Planctomycetota bacterium]
WIHIYVSMLSYTTLLFFAITGITLNHPTWLGGSEQVVQDYFGELPPDIADSLAAQEPDKLEIAEWLRDRYQLKGKVTEFEIDDFECMLVFKGPGYAADAFVDRETGTYMVTVTSSNLIAVLNDLHKGRDSGIAWKLFIIDGSAILMGLFSLSGFGLIFYLKRRRVPGLWTSLVGTIALIAAWLIWVP